MEERINNQKSPQNTNLQSKFWKILLKKNSIKNTDTNFKVRVGRYFLNQNLHWLTH